MNDDNLEVTVGPRRTRARRVADERGQGLIEYALIIALVSLAATVALGFLSGKIGGLFSKAGNSLGTATESVGSGGTPPPNGTIVTISGQTYRFYNPGPAHAGTPPAGQADCGGSDAACGGHVGFYTDSATHPGSFSSGTGSWSGGYTSTPPWSFSCSWHSSGWWDPSGPAWDHGCW